MLRALLTTSRRRHEPLARREPPAHPAPRACPAPDDTGQVMLLSIACGLLALLLVTAVVSATGIHLERKELLALADLAALEAADALDEPGYYAHPGGEPLRLSPATVRASVEGYLAEAPEADRFSDLVIVEATTEDGRTATVTLAALAHPALISTVTAPWSDGIALEVTTSARVD